MIHTGCIFVNFLACQTKYLAYHEFPVPFFMIISLIRRKQGLLAWMEGTMGYIDQNGSSGSWHNKSCIQAYNCPQSRNDGIASFSHV